MSFLIIVMILKYWLGIGGINSENSWVNEYIAENNLVGLPIC